jgi:hypothetical protein
MEELIVHGANGVFHAHAHETRSGESSVLNCTHLLHRLRSLHYSVLDT